MDGRTDHGNHWHGDLPGMSDRLAPSAVARWIKAFDEAAPVLAAAGVKVINHSGVSALTGFRKEPLPEVTAMHVRFTDDFDFTPPEDPRSTVAYRAGWSGSVRRECGRQAIDQGKAEEVEAPARDPLDHDQNGRKGGARKPKVG